MKHLEKTLDLCSVVSALRLLCARLSPICFCTQQLRAGFRPFKVEGLWLVNWAADLLFPTGHVTALSTIPLRNTPSRQALLGAGSTEGSLGSKYYWRDRP